ncbi:MAG: FliM/FliN family flagellar motor switch protein [Microthrixaceae bacterium]
MSIGTDTPTDEFVGLLVRVVDDAAAALAGEHRTAGPATVLEGVDDLQPSSPNGIAGLVLTFGNGAVVTVVTTAELGIELCGGLAPDQLRVGLGALIDELGASLAAPLLDVGAVADRSDLLAAHGSHTVLAGAGVFDEDAVVATVGASGTPAVAASARDTSSEEEPFEDSAPGTAPIDSDVAGVPAASTELTAEAPAGPDDGGFGIGDGDGPVTESANPHATTIAAAAVAAHTPHVPAPVASTVPPLTSGVTDDVLARGLALLSDVNMVVTAELGRSHLRLAELLALEPGSVIGLERQAGSPVDLLINGSPFARAEVIVIEDNYAVRITELLGGAGTP